MADVHLGNHKRFGGTVESGMNARCSRTLRVFRDAVRRADELQCDAFVVLGDLFDYVKPEPQLIAEVQGVLAGVSDRMQVVLLVGNHEQVTMRPGDHALGPLLPFATVVDAPGIITLGDDFELWCVPPRPGKADDWLPGVLRDMSSSRTERRAACPPERRALGVHLGIRDSDTAPWLAAAQSSVHIETLQTVCAEHDTMLQTVLAGDWHDRRRWAFKQPKLDVLQLGALVPTGWDNPGLDGYGTLAILEDGKLRYEELPGPRFVKAATRAEIDEDVAASLEKGHQLFVSQTCAPNELSARRAALGDVEAIVGLEVLPDTRAAEAAARSAAESARSSETLEQALAEYVGKLKLPDGVSRDALLTRSREFLKL